MADNAFLRMRGLLGRKEIVPGEGLFLDSCNCIHMIGMGYAIDAIFLDANWKVVGLVEAIKPGQVSAVYAGARTCLELPAGTISATTTQLGDLIEMQDAPT